MKAYAIVSLDSRPGSLARRFVAPSRHVRTCWPRTRSRGHRSILIVDLNDAAPSTTARRQIVSGSTAKRLHPRGPFSVSPLWHVVQPRRLQNDCVHKFAEACRGVPDDAKLRIGTQCAHEYFMC